MSLAVLLKPRERIFQVGFLAATAMSVALLGDSLAPLEFVLSDREYAVFSLLRVLPPIRVILGYDFFSRFPPGVAPGRFWTRLRLGF